MKLIKMVYIAHGWHLAIKGEPLIDEAVEAWKYGPVVPLVYQNFRCFRDSQITRMAHVLHDNHLISPEVDSNDTRQFLESVWDAYSQYTGPQLSAITHQKNTPWYQTWHNGGNLKDGVIVTNDVIKSHYVELASRRKNARPK